MPDAVEQRRRVRLFRYAFENQHSRAAHLQHAAPAGSFPFVTFATFSRRHGISVLRIRITLPRSRQVSSKEVACVYGRVPRGELRNKHVRGTCAFIKRVSIAAPTVRSLLGH